MAVAIAATAGVASADRVVRATLGPPVIGLGETAVLTIEVTGSSLGSLHLRPDFQLENLDFASGPSRSEDVTFANGVLKHSYRVSWRLRPRGVGKARVRDLRLQLDDEVIPISDREIAVQAAPTGQSEAPAEEPDDPFERLFSTLPFPGRAEQPSRRPAVFLRAEIQPLRPYVGQQVLYTVYLYTHDDISSMAAREMPTFRGFWVRDVPQPQHLPTEIVNMGGQRFARVAVLRKALFPLRPGRYTIESSAMDLIARVVEQRFFGPPFAHAEQVALRTQPMAIEVQPLPAPPPGFAGAVGQLAMTARLEPAELRLGEAATLTVTLHGRGNVQGVAEPRIAPPPGLKIFPPQQQSEEGVVGTTVQGSHTWSWVVVPERTGQTLLRVPYIPYFDPQSAGYRVASAPAIAVTTLAPAAPANPAAGVLQSLRGSGAGQERLGRLHALDGIPWPRALPWLVALPCGIGLLAALARRRRPPFVAAPGQASRSASPPGTPSPGDEIERRLRDAAAEPRPRQAAARLEEAWRELLARRWGVPPGTPSPRWAAELVARGGDAAAAEELVRLAEDLHYLRYAPQLSAADSMCAEALARSRRLLRRLR